MDAAPLFAIAGAVLAFGFISQKVAAGPLTPPMAFTAIGFIIGPAVLGLPGIEADRPVVLILAKLTLVIVLFTDASRVHLRLLVREHDLPMRLLGIGLPLTMALGTVAAWLLFDQLTFWQAAIIAVFLAPTDAALGQAVVSNTHVPARIRQTVNVESGLNDGLALPAVLIALSLADATMESGGWSIDQWAGFIALQLVLGLLVGAAVGVIGGKLVQWTRKAGWMNAVFLRLSAVGLAILAYGGAELAHGNGFIAAFVAGLAVGNVARDISPQVHMFGEAEGQLMALLTFLVFGAVLVPPALALVDGTILLYAVLSLTVVRMVPVALSLLGTKLGLRSILFLGWFGPRGIASILFLMIALDRSAIVSDTDMAVVTTTVLLSILAHGVTAGPLVWLYGGHCRRLATTTPHCPEHKSVTELPLRLAGRHARHEAG